MNLTAAQSAINSLQGQALRRQDGYTLDRLDRALDEIVRNYENERPAAWQVRSALANAAKVVQSRRAVVTLTPRTEGDSRGRPDTGSVDDAFAVAEVRDWLWRTPALTDDERKL